MTHLEQTPDPFSQLCRDILWDLRGVDWQIEPAALSELRSGAEMHLRQLMTDRGDVQDMYHKQPVIKLSQRLYLTKTAGR